MTNKFKVVTEQCSVITSILVFVLFVFVFVGCGGSSNNATTTSTTSTSGSTVSGSMSTTSKGKLKLPSKNVLKVKKGKNGKLSQLEITRQKAIASAMQKKLKKYATAYIPLASASVTLFDALTGEALATATTDSNGNYSLTGVPAGKGYVIVGMKYDATTGDVTTIKIAIEDLSQVTDADGDGDMDMPECNPETTLAAQEYVNDLKDAADTNGDGTVGADEITAFDDTKYDDIDYDALEQKFEEMTDTAMLSLWYSFDESADALYAQYGGDEDAILEASMDVANDELDAVGDLISTADSAWESAMQTALGTDYQAKLDQYYTLIDAAYAQLDTTLAGIDATASSYEDDYFQYLADELIKLGVTGITAESLHANAEISEATLDATLSTSTAVNVINAAWERYYAEQELINVGTSLADVDADLDTLEDALAAALAACGDTCYSSDSVDNQAVMTAYDNLWEYTKEYSVDEAASILKITITDAEFDRIDAMMGNEVYNDTTGHYISFEDTNSDSIYQNGEPVIDWDAADEAATAAAQSSMPAEPNWTTATEAEMAAYYEAYNDYWQVYDVAYHENESAQFEVALGIMGISWASSATELSNLENDIHNASNTAWETYVTASDVYWSTVGSQYDTAWTTLDSAITAAYTSVGLTQEQIDTAYAAADAAYWTAVNQINSAGTISGDVLASLGDAYETPAEDHFVEDVVAYFEQIGADATQIYTIKASAYDYQKGTITKEEFTATADKLYEEILIAQGLTSQQVDQFMNEVNTASSELVTDLGSATTQTTITTAYTTYEETLTQTVTSLDSSGTKITTTETTAIVGFYSYVESVEIAQTAKKKALKRAV